MTKAQERVDEYLGCTDTPFASAEREAFLAGYEQALDDVKEEVMKKIKSHTKRQNTIIVTVLRDLENFVSIL